MKKIFQNKKVFVGLIVLVIVGLYVVKEATKPPEKIILAGKMHYRGEYKDDTSTLLDDGKVLIVGGGCGTPQAEIYDPDTDTFSIVGTPHSTHYGHTTLLLKNGNVLIVSFEGTEIFDKETKTFKILNNMQLFNAFHERSKKKIDFYPLIVDKFLILKNGDILFFNGIYKNYNIRVFDSTSFKQKKVLEVPYQLKDFELLSDGNVLSKCFKFIGRTEYKSGYFKENFDYIGRGLYNPKNNTFKLIKNYQETAEQIKQKETYAKAIAKFDKVKKTFEDYNLHEPIVLKSGRILFLGEKRNYIYDPKIDNLYRINNFNRWRRGFATTVLNNGNVLITGGSCGNQESHAPFDEAELFIDK